MSELPDNSDSTFLLADAEYNAATDKTSRNKVIRKKLRDIDLAYSEFESSLYQESVITDLTTDITLLALTGGTVLTGSSKEKEILAAVSAFILGSKSAFDKRALLESSMSVLVQKMRADRAMVRNDILRGEGQDILLYRVESAAMDILRYYYAGTIPSALTGLAKVVVDEEKTAKEEQKKILNEQFVSDQARACLLDHWKPGGTINPTNQSDITTWLSASKYTGMQFGIFMNASSASNARIDAVNALVGLGKIGICEL